MSAYTYDFLPVYIEVTLLNWLIKEFEYILKQYIYLTYLQIYRDIYMNMSSRRTL